MHTVPQTLLFGQSVLFKIVTSGVALFSYEKGSHIRPRFTDLEEKTHS